MLNSKKLKWGAAPLLASLFFSADAMALTIGEIRVLSHLGEPFKATIPLTAADNEKIDTSCIALDRSASADGIYRLSDAALTLRQQDGAEVLQLFSRQSINEPVVSLQLVVQCASGKFTKTFTVLLDPAQEGALPAPAAAPLPVAAPAPLQKPASPAAAKNGEKWTIKKDDTLSAIAHEHYPGNRWMQRRMIQEILKANPGVSPYSLQEGEVIQLPDMKSVPPHPKAERREPATETAAATVQKPVEHKAATPVPRLNILPGEAQGGVDKKQLKNTEEQLLSKADDQTVQILQLKDQIKRLEERLSDLQTKIVVSDKQLAQLKNAAATPATPPRRPLHYWLIAAGAALLLLAAAGIWYFLGRKKEEKVTMEDLAPPPPPARPALTDHLDFFETSETPDHHRW